MSSFKAKLKAAKELYVQKNYREALERCTAALQDNEESPDGLLLQGKIMYELQEYQASGKAYNALLRLHPKLLPAWKGLAELYTITNNDAEAVEVYEKLIQIGTSEGKERQQGYYLKLASLQQQLGQTSDAAQHFQQLLHGPLALMDELQRLHVECQLADLQMSSDAESGDLQALLESIVSQTAPDARHAVYHAKHLESSVHKMELQPARSQHRVKQVTACHDTAWHMMQSKPGGCCTALPFQIALLFAEDQEVADAVGKFRLTHLGRRMYHQFPWLPDSCAALGLTLYDQLITKGAWPSKTKDRTLVAQVLSRAMKGSADSLQGWQRLSQLQLQNQQPDQAAESAAKGLKCLRQRQNRGYCSQPDIAAAIVLARGQSLCALDCADDALVMFNALTDDDAASPVKQLLESVPQAISQDAVRGQSLAAKQGGDNMAAEALLSEVVHAENQFPQVQHLAQADYGVLLHQLGKVEDAKLWLEKASVSASLEGACATDKQMAQTKYQLGCVCWDLGLDSQVYRAEAQSHWLASAAVAGAHQAGAFAKLGWWYADFKGDKLRARKCFQRALGLDSLQAEAGEGLCSLLKGEGRADTAQALCHEISTRAPGATWAWRRLAFFALDAADFEKAVVCFQTALRGDVKHVGAWEGLGSAYQSLARLTAALKAYGRAIELEPGRLFSLVQSGLVCLALGMYTQAHQLLHTALQTDSTHVPALFAAAQLLLASAKFRIAQGTPGMAGEELATAAGYCWACSQHNGNLQAIWKLMGDVYLQFHATTPPHQEAGHQTAQSDGQRSRQSGKSARASKGALQDALHSWQLRIQAMQTSRKAYLKALHLAPGQGSLWGDLGATVYHEAQLRRVHPRLEPSKSPGLRAAAEKIMRGGVRLEPSSAELWAGLGTCASQPQHQEYAFSRALQLDPKSAHTWAALGRLYMECGARHLADTCFTQARSQEPADAATWAAMGALAGLSPTGASDKADFYEHAVKLGAGPEALAGFAEGAVGAGRASSGGVYAAARKIVEAQPYNAAAYNVLGLACEARGDFDGAVKAYTDGLDVMTDTEAGSGESKDRIAGPLSLVQQDTQSSQGLQQALDLNLARALMLSSRCGEACDQFKSLDIAGHLNGQAAAWLSYASALHQLKGSSDEGGAQHALEQGLSASPTPQEHAALLHAWMKLKLSSSQPNIKQLFGHVQKLQAAKPEVALLKPLWATISAAAAASTESMATALRGVVRAWRGQADDDSAEVNADLVGLDAMQAHQAGHKHKASRLAARAVHACPWKPLPKAVSARTSIDASPTLGSCAMRISSLFTLTDLCQASGSYRMLSSDVVGKAAMLDMFAVRVTGLAGQPCVSDTVQQVQATYKVAMQWAHSQPHNAIVWYLLATTALHYAACAHQAAAYRSATALCKHAQRLLSSALKPQHSQSSDKAAGQEQQQHQHMQVKLQCMKSECQLHGRQAEAADQALASAKAAVQTASGFQDSGLIAVALQQLSRCLEEKQRHAEAEMACRKAVAACPQNPSAGLQLAALMQSTGKHQDALHVLRQAKEALSQSDKPSSQRWQVMLQLREAEVMAAIGDLHQACSMCQQALDFSITAGLSLQPHTITAQVLYGSLSLQLVETDPDSPQTGAVLVAAHKVLSQAMASQGQMSQKDAAVTCMLLAQIELRGNLRRKQERAETHALQALRLWPKPVPGSLYHLAATLQPEGLPLCCKAVHVEPWRSSYRELLQVLVA